MPVLADNEMVVHRDTEGARDLHNRLRHLDVGARGGRIARGMVVQQSSLASQGIEPKILFGIRRNRWGMGLGSVARDPT